MFRRFLSWLLRKKVTSTSQPTRGKKLENSVRVAAPKQSVTHTPWRVPTSLSQEGSAKQVQQELAKKVESGSAEDKAIEEIMNDFYAVIDYKYRETPVIYVMSAMLNICMQTSARQDVSKDDFIASMSQMYELVLDGFRKYRDRVLN